MLRSCFACRFNGNIFKAVFNIIHEISKFQYNKSVPGLKAIAFETFYINFLFIAFLPKEAASFTCRLNNLLSSEGTTVTAMRQIIGGYNAEF